MNRTPLSAALLILTLATGLHAQAEFSPQSMLKPKTTGLYTIPPNLDARGAYDTLGAKAGINMVYIPAFKQDTPVVLRIEGQTFFEAMDRLSEQTRTFWFPWDSKTIILAPNAQQQRRDLEPRIHKTFYLDGKLTPEAFSNLTATLRTRLQMRGLQPAPEANAIVAYDTPATLAAAEKIVAELTQSLPIRASAPLAFPENGTIYLSIAEGSKVRRVVPSTRSQMEKTLVGSVSIDSTQPARGIYEDLAMRAGMNVIFDRQMNPRPGVRFHVEGVDLIDALDLLALQTQTIWQPLNESTFYVMDDNQQNRRDREFFIVKVIFLPELATTARLNETLNVLRSSLYLRGIFQNENRKAIVIRDTPLRVFMAEKIVEDLMKNVGKPTSVPVTTETSSFYSENGWMLGNASKARPELEVKLRNKTTVRLTETPKGAVEALAGLAGLQVVFDSSFADSAEISFNATNVDILDAFDLLAWQTRLFWQVVDKHTIRVIPETQATRRNQEPMIQKTIVPADPRDAASLLNLLRTAFGLRGVQLDEKNNIAIRDTSDNVAIVEKVVEILGKGAIQQ